MPVTTVSTDVIEILRSNAAAIDTTVSWFDTDVSVAVPVLTDAGTEIHNFTGAPSGAETILAAPSGAGKRRNLRQIQIFNNDASLTCDVTVRINRSSGATIGRGVKFTLIPGATLEFTEGTGWFVLQAPPYPIDNFSVSAQGPGFSSDTYLVGSDILLPAPPQVGSFYNLVFDVTKTNAGTATPIITIRFGTAGTTADTARCTLTFGSGTAAVDAGIFEIGVMFRTVGSGTSAVMQGRARLTSNLTTTGISNAVKAVNNTGGGFDSTVASSKIGASYNGGASASHTIQLVRAEWTP